MKFEKNEVTNNKILNSNLNKKLKVTSPNRLAQSTQITNDNLNNNQNIFNKQALMNKERKIFSDGNSKHLNSNINVDYMPKKNANNNNILNTKITSHNNINDKNVNNGFSSKDQNKNGKANKSPFADNSPQVENKKIIVNIIININNSANTDLKSNLNIENENSKLDKIVNINKLALSNELLLNKTNNKNNENTKNYEFNKEAIDSSIFEFIPDTDINSKNIKELEVNITEIESEFKQEVLKLKEKYEIKLQKYHASLEFLRKNPYLKNIKEYESFTKFMGRFENYKLTNKSANEEDNSTLNANSIYVLNPIKISDYKPSSFLVKEKKEGF